MKKKTLIIALAVSCAVLSGCGNTTSEISSDKDSSSSTSESVSSADESSAESNDTSTDDSSSDSTSIDNTSTSDTSSDEQSEIIVPDNYGYEYFKDDLFIGDSIFAGLTLYGILDADNVAASFGNSIHGAHYNTLDNYNGTAVDYAQEMQPAHINIMLGTNMLGMLGSETISFTSMVDDYKSLINALEAACPNSQICVISVPSVTADNVANDSGVTKDLVDTANEHIEKICTEMNIKYFDLNTHLSDNDGYLKDEYAEMDGIHFMRDTYDVLLYGLEKMWK